MLCFTRGYAKAKGIPYMFRFVRLQNDAELHGVIKDEKTLLRNYLNAPTTTMKPLVIASKMDATMKRDAENERSATPMEKTKNNSESIHATPPMKRSVSAIADKCRDSNMVRQALMWTSESPW